MRKLVSWTVILISIALFGFGLGCFNYTKPSGLEHHREVAVENNWPAPSDNIVKLGVVCVAIASGSAGYVIGRRMTSTSIE